MVFYLDLWRDGWREAEGVGKIKGKEAGVQEFVSFCTCSFGITFFSG